MFKFVPFCLKMNIFIITSSPCISYSFCLYFIRLILLHFNISNTFRFFNILICFSRYQRRLKYAYLDILPQSDCIEHFGDYIDDAKICTVGTIDGSPCNVSPQFKIFSFCQFRSAWHDHKCCCRATAVDPWSWRKQMDLAQRSVSCLLEDQAARQMPVSSSELPASSNGYPLEETLWSNLESLRGESSG